MGFSGVTLDSCYSKSNLNLQNEQTCWILTNFMGNLYWPGNLKMALHDKKVANPCFIWLANLVFLYLCILIHIYFIS